jgi:hypothetical protein
MIPALFAGQTYYVKLPPEYALAFVRIPRVFFCRFFDGRSQLCFSKSANKFYKKSEKSFMLFPKPMAYFRNRKRIEKYRLERQFSSFLFCNFLL